MKTVLKTKSSLAIALLAIGILATSPAFAEIKGGDAKNGRVLAREKCKHCHIAGAEGGTMTPLSKTQRQWERFYTKGKHNELAPGAWDKIPPTELSDIIQFMYDHAADSDQPETCGQ